MYMYIMHVCGLQEMYTQCDGQALQFVVRENIITKNSTRIITNKKHITCSVLCAAAYRPTFAIFESHYFI